MNNVTAGFITRTGTSGDVRVTSARDTITGACWELGMFVCVLEWLHLHVRFLTLAAGIRRVLVTETAICPAGEDTSGVKGSVRYDSSGLMCTR